MPKNYDAVIVGSGPNGLAAAITLARAGLSVVILEANRQIGGGTRSQELTLPGFTHDVCSAVHPLASASPFFHSVPLAEYGLEWIDSPFSLAHPLDDGTAVTIEHSVTETAKNLGVDEHAYIRFMQPFADNWEALMEEILQPILHFPKHPFRLARFGILGLLSADALVKSCFKGERARSLFLGIAAHANAPLTQSGTGAIGLMLMLAAHARGWPIPRGGSQKIADAMAGYFKKLGGEIRTEHFVESLKDIPQSRLVFFDLVPKQVLTILKSELKSSRQSSFEKFKSGPGVFKVDWALSAPIPWRANNCASAATVHIGGSPEEMIKSEACPQAGRLPEAPYVLLSQPSLFDSSRAPRGEHVGWAYCHVPNGSTVDMTEIIESQVERFAPGFKKIIKGRSTMNTSALESHNRNLIGGDISGGAVDLRQLLFRPRFGMNPYEIERGRFYLCSSSTPPGPGVHGMGGFNAATAALNSRK
jgi:phytoene dehydrogenase-like protein